MVITKKQRTITAICISFVAFGLLSPPSLWAAPPQDVSDNPSLQTEDKTDALINGGGIPLDRSASRDSIKAINDILQSNKAEMPAYHQGQLLAIHYATQNNYIESLERLALKENADVNVVDQHGLTPLNYAAKHNNIKAVEILLQADADVYIKDPNGLTPLDHATFKGHKQVIALLSQHGATASQATLNYQLIRSIIDQNITMASQHLANGAEADSATPDDDTPLHWAAASDEPQLIHLLLKANANIEAKDPEHKTPLHRAASNGYAKTVSALLKANANTNAKDIYGKTPIYYAAQDGHVEVIKVFQQIQTNIDFKSIIGSNLLHVAAYAGQTKVIEHLLQTTELDINAQDNDGQTPLHEAAYTGHLKAVKILLQANASTSIRNKKSQTALDCAIEKRHDQVIEFIRISNNIARSPHQYHNLTF